MAKIKKDMLTASKLGIRLRHWCKNTQRVLQKLYDEQVTYEKDGQFYPLVHMLVANPNKKILYIMDEAEALSVFEKEFEKFLACSHQSRSDVLNREEISKMLHCDKKRVTAALNRLQESNVTYEFEGKERPLVHKYKRRCRRVATVVDNNPVALETLRKSLENDSLKQEMQGNFLTVTEIAKMAHTRISDTYSFFQKANAEHVTYTSGGIKRPLVQKMKFGKHLHWVIERDPEAIETFMHFVHPFIRVGSLAEQLGVSGEIVNQLLKELYEQKVTYMHSGQTEDLVHRYMYQDHFLYGLDNRADAIAVCRKKLQDFQRILQAQRCKKKTNIHNLLVNTSLDLEDIRALGRGFRTRLCAVRRWATKWIEAGVPAHRLYAQVHPETENIRLDRELLKKIPQCELRAWRSEVLKLMTVLMLIETSKKEGKDFKTILKPQTPASYLAIREQWRAQNAQRKPQYGPLKSAVRE